MATICAVDLTVNYNYSISHFFTFGSPRVGTYQIIINFFLQNILSYYFL